MKGCNVGFGLRWDTLGNVALKQRIASDPRLKLTQTPHEKPINTVANNDINPKITNKHK